MKKVILSICVLLCAYTMMAQNQDDMATIKLHISNTEAGGNSPGKRIVKIQKTYNPGKLLLYVPLYFYQQLLSEQLTSGCSFEPSCSAFSILSIKQLGILEGLLLTADRLTRCNGTADVETAPYLFDHAKIKVIDEPGMYRSIH
jgi:putative component of membrane protein insertase Oxa1/YidC/SpoIIIJ protein YidD